LWIMREYQDETPRQITIKGDNITYLECAGIQLTALDVSRNAALTWLSCRINQLTALDVRRNAALTVLRCDRNQLTRLDVSRNVALEELDCRNNQLSALDVSRNVMLKFLTVSDNQLKRLDVGQNAELKVLSCGENQLNANALNDLFSSLHVVTTQYKGLNVNDNPGTAGCDPSIVRGKGWELVGVAQPKDATATAPASVENFDYYARIYKPVIDDLKSARTHYAIFDINKNGIPELLFIGDEGWSSQISDIYTIVDGSPVYLFEPPWNRYGSSEILSSGLISDPTGSAIYKISVDGKRVVTIAHTEEYDYPYEASRALAQRKFYINEFEVTFDFYVQYLKEQGYMVLETNAAADIDWIEFSSVSQQQPYWSIRLRGSSFSLTMVIETDGLDSDGYVIYDGQTEQMTIKFDRFEAANTPSFFAHGQYFYNEIYRDQINGTYILYYDGQPRSARYIRKRDNREFELKIEN